MKKILVPVDGSESCHLAVDKAKELGAPFNAEIVLMTVVDDTSIAHYDEDTRDIYDLVRKDRKEISQKTLALAKDRLQGYTGSVELVSRFGGVASSIVSYADNNGVDMIVMGNRGLGAFSRTLLGSVSNKVMNTSHIPVYIVKGEYS